MQSCPLLKNHHSIANMKIIHPILVAIGLLSAVVSCSQNKECQTLKLVSKCGNEPCTYKVDATGPFISDHLKRKWIVYASQHDCSFYGCT